MLTLEISTGKKKELLHLIKRKKKRDNKENRRISPRKRKIRCHNDSKTK